MRYDKAAIELGRQLGIRDLSGRLPEISIFTSVPTALYTAMQSVDTSNGYAVDIVGRVDTIRRKPYTIVVSPSGITITDPLKDLNPFFGHGIPDAHFSFMKQAVTAGWTWRSMVAATGHPGLGLTATSTDHDDRLTSEWYQDLPAMFGLDDLVISYSTRNEFSTGSPSAKLNWNTSMFDGVISGGTSTFYTGELGSGIDVPDDETWMVTPAGTAGHTSSTPGVWYGIIRFRREGIFRGIRGLVMVTGASPTGSITPANATMNTPVGFKVYGHSTWESYFPDSAPGSYINHSVPVDLTAVGDNTVLNPSPPATVGAFNEDGIYVFSGYLLGYPYPAAQLSIEFGDSPDYTDPQMVTTTAQEVALSWTPEDVKMISEATVDDDTLGVEAGTVAELEQKLIRSIMLPSSVLIADPADLTEVYSRVISNGGSSDDVYNAVIIKADEETGAKERTYKQLANEATGKRYVLWHQVVPLYELLSGDTWTFTIEDGVGITLEGPLTTTVIPWNSPTQGHTELVILALVNDFVIETSTGGVATLADLEAALQITDLQSYIDRDWKNEWKDSRLAQRYEGYRGIPPAKLPAQQMLQYGVNKQDLHKVPVALLTLARAIAKGVHDTLT
jgi:hypothetical protein